MMKKELTSRDLDVLAALNDQKWQAPRNVSRGTLTARELYASLRKLVRRGLVEHRARRRHFTRASYYYRLTKAGDMKRMENILLNERNEIRESFYGGRVEMCLSVEKAKLTVEVEG